MARLVPLTQAGREFDIEFWQAQSAEARFSAAWEMVKEHAAMMGISERDLRFRKDVQTIEYLPGSQPRRRRTRRLANLKNAAKTNRTRSSDPHPR
jgi:hypothetical protein